MSSSFLAKLQNFLGRDESKEADLISGHYAEIQSIYREMRGWRHDYHNHLQTIKGHLALGQMAELTDYLQELEADLDQVDSLIKSGNIMLDAILNSKITLAKDKGIPLDATASAPEQLCVSDIDLCVILGNLIDNAIEANLHIREEAKRFIRIYVGIFKQQFYISVQNAVAGTLQRDGGGFFPSTKTSRRGGNGLKRIDATVERYHGYVNRQHEPGVFATEILLPL